MEILSLSENAKAEYCASVVRIGELKPVENSDFLCQTIVDGYSMVVRKDEVKEGDLMVYCCNETQLNKEFLSVNNLFELSSRELNANYQEVEALMTEGKEDEAKRKVGFFNKHGRVKMIRLRGCPSMGFLVSQKAIARWKPEFATLNLEDCVGKDFDTICGDLFIKVYVPFVQPKREQRSPRWDKRLKRYDRMIEGEFHFHYETDPLNKNIGLFKPNDIVTITCKLHGTSLVIANVLVKYPKTLKTNIKWLKNLFDKMYAKLPGKWQKYTIGFGNVYSSRTVIKNQFISFGVESQSFYDVDIWGEYNTLLEDYVEKGMSLYGEICGYLTGTQQMIQKEYDYGCQEGENFVMIYRITTKDENGRVREWNVMDVKRWTENLITAHPELAKRVKPINVLYHGILKDLYPDLVIDDHWHENLLERMKSDTANFGMEQNEPLCKKKVPREGICIRIDNDSISECFKLKCVKFLEKERSLIDKGEVDIETASAYGDVKG